YAKCPSLMQQFADTPKPAGSRILTAAAGSRGPETLSHKSTAGPAVPDLTLAGPGSGVIEITNDFPNLRVEPVPFTTVHRRGHPTKPVPARRLKFARKPPPKRPNFRERFFRAVLEGSPTSKTRGSRDDNRAGRWRRSGGARSGQGDDHP